MQPNTRGHPRAQHDVVDALLLCCVWLQGSEDYLLPKPVEPQQWPLLVLEPMFWLLFAVQSMIRMGEPFSTS